LAAFESHNHSVPPSEKSFLASSESGILDDVRNVAIGDGTGR
jgi:hypothetical protein